MGSSALSTNTADTTRSLEGKVVIVTGGASKVGSSTARLFSERGCQVIVADTQEPELGRALVRELGSSVSFIQCDVSDEDQVRALVDAAVAEHGRLDIMFNNASLDGDHARGMIPSILEDDDDNNNNDNALERVLDVNMRGAFFGAKHAARVMGPAGRGCILFGSGGGGGGHLDSMSKYGMIGLTRNLSAELGKKGIKVNCISLDVQNPDSDHVGVARAALYLASDDANYVSGHHLCCKIEMVHID